MSHVLFSEPFFQSRVLMPDAERLDLAKKLIGWLQEDPNNVGFALHQEADRFVAEGRFDDAVECCRSSMLLAQRANDAYARGASQFHHGLAFFVLRENDWDRAAKLCEDAARAFHTYSLARGEGASYFAAAKILEDACNRGKDRWQAAMRDALQALLTLKEIPDLARVSQDHYNRFSKRYSAHLQQRASESATTTKAPNATTISAPTTLPAPTGAAVSPETTPATPAETSVPPDATPPAAPSVITSPTAAPETLTGETVSAPVQAVSNPVNAAPPTPYTLPPTASGPAPDGRDEEAAAPALEPLPHAVPESAPRRRSQRLSNPPAVRFGSWWRTFLITAFVAATLILALAGYGFITLLLSVPALGIGFAIGVVATVVATLIPFGALYLAQQLFFYGRPTYAAVVTDVTDGRVWTFEDEERHWLLPFRQLLAAWLPLQLRQTPRFQEQIAVAEGAPIAAQLILFYRVVNAGLVWDRIAGNLTPTLVLGIPLPYNPDATGIKMDDYAEKVVSERLRRIARGVTDAAQPLEGSVLERALVGQLRREAEATGLFFKKVSVAPYARWRPT